MLLLGPRSERGHCMNLEATIAAGLLALACFPALAAFLRTRRRAALAAACVFALALPGANAARRQLGAPSPIDPERIDRPVEVAQDGYVSSDTCRACHPDQYASWHASYHRTMTQEATPEAVQGAFDGQRLEAGGVGFRLERRGEGFYVEIDRPGEERDERPIVLTTGSHHYQVYWMASEKKGVLRALPFVYLFDAQRWIPRKAAFLSPPVAPRVEEKARWNNGCAKCHSVNAKWRPVRPHTDTQVAEFGISCESCHGPAEEHVRANRDPRRRYAQHLDGEADPSIVEPTRLPSRRASEVCGQCHGISLFPDRDDFNDWAHNGYRYRPGDVLADTRAIVRGRLEANTPEMQRHLAERTRFLEDSFWSDGVVRIAGREYNGLLETPCFQRGELSCMSCHELHRPDDDPRPLAVWADDQLAPGMRGNEACTQCHAELAAPQALQAHTFHEPDSRGSRCYDCHMPYTTYGLMKAIRSHTVTSPDVANNLETGRPNACNQCHLDRTLAWAASSLSERYGISEPSLTEDEREIAASVLWLLRGDAGQRALAAWSMGWEPATAISGGDWVVPYLAQLLVDPYDAVRFVAQRSLRRQPGFADLDVDPLGSLAEAAGVARQTIEAWDAQTGGETRTRDAAVLLDAEGRLRRELITRLLSQRDDRPVTFRE